MFLSHLHRRFLLFTIQGHLAIVSLLVEEGANVNSNNTNGANPLFWAAKSGHLEVSSR